MHLQPAPYGGRPRPHPLGSAVGLIGYIDIGDRSVPAAEDGTALRCVLENALFAFTRASDPAAYFLNRQAVIQPFDERRTQCCKRFVGELRGVLEIIGCNRQKVLGGELVILLFPGKDRSELLPAGHPVYRGSATLGTC